MEEDGVRWPPRSSKPLAVIYCSGRFDSCPFRINGMADTNKLRSIPQLERLLSITRFSPFIKKMGRTIVAEIARNEIARFRDEILKNVEPPSSTIEDRLEHALQTAALRRLQRVINGTGVIIHTNFGRAPLPRAILNDLSNELSGYCNLEFYIPEKRRGKRGGFAEEQICSLTGAEDALVVNNNAAALFLILSEFARNRSVVISRGELVQIGGGFRIPDIMRQSGARLIEVGTTNITTLEDYRSAIDADTAMILSVHRSNFTMEGFTKSPGLAELASLKSENLLLVRDLGSGNFVSDRLLPKPFEPTIFFELSLGPDLVSFSGDKLLGTSQAGIIVGRKELIEKLRKNPLMRVIRVDKVTYHLLQNILLYYANGEWHTLPLWEMILAPVKDIKRRALRFMRLLPGEMKQCASIIPLKSTFGGGAMPTAEIESLGVSLTIGGLSASEIYDHFIAWRVPIAGIIINDTYALDFRTVFDRDIREIADAAIALFYRRSE